MMHYLRPIRDYQHPPVREQPSFDRAAAAAVAAAGDAPCSGYGWLPGVPRLGCGPAGAGSGRLLTRRRVRVAPGSPRPGLRLTRALSHPGPGPVWVRPSRGGRLGAAGQEAAGQGAGRSGGQAGGPAGGGRDLSGRPAGAARLARTGPRVERPGMNAPALSEGRVTAGDAPAARRQRHRA